MVETIERVPNWLQYLIPFFHWRRSSRSPAIYLTFDDGPTPEVTSAVLEVLERQKVPATFFMLGEMVDKHPELAKEVLSQGHSIGNHGYAHLSGWRTSLFRYLADVKRGRQSIEQHLNVKAKMFRPPYGAIGPLQGYCLWWFNRIMMFDVIAQDYREDIDAASVQQIVLRNIRHGSIVLLHDSQLAAPRLLPILEPMLIELKSRGFEFAKL
jgi:peptidoglycan-N-acetylglucosamine deacetylase